ncbi:MAG: hypothetical protein IIA87_04325 [Nanoarchaeota archaeon]|nr:hypothetical protein [Nanoarchaeota archaeon]
MGGAKENFLELKKRDDKESKALVKSIERVIEIIKELFTAIALIDGCSVRGENAHKDLIDFMKKYREFSEFDIEVIQDLRIRRNKSSYEGKQIESIYLQNKREKLSKIIERSKKILNEKLK